MTQWRRKVPVSAQLGGRRPRHGQGATSGSNLTPAARHRIARSRTGARLGRRRRSASDGRRSRPGRVRAGRRLGLRRRSSHDRYERRPIDHDATGRRAALVKEDRTVASATTGCSWKSNATARYWSRWTNLFQPGTGSLATGAADKIAAAIVMLTVGSFVCIDAIQSPDRRSGRGQQARRARGSPYATRASTASGDAPKAGPAVVPRGSPATPNVLHVASSDIVTETVELAFDRIRVE